MVSNLAETLGVVRNERARDILWSFVERGIGWAQSLIVITWRKDVRDLPRLGLLLTAPATGNPIPDGIIEPAVRFAEFVWRRSTPVSGGWTSAFGLRLCADKLRS